MRDHAKRGAHRCQRGGVRRRQRLRRLRARHPRITIEYRLLGGSEPKVPVFSLGTGTFGGTTRLFEAFGTNDGREATRFVDISLEHGLNLCDSADIYSAGHAEISSATPSRGGAMKC